MLFCIQQNQKLFWRSKKYLGIDLFNSTISRMSEHYIQIFALIFHRWWRCTIFDKKSTSKRDYKNGLVLSYVLCQFIYLALSINSIDISIRYGYILYIWLRYNGCNIILQMWWCISLFKYEIYWKNITALKTFI